MFLNIIKGLGGRNLASKEVVVSETDAHLAEFRKPFYSEGIVTGWT